MCLPAGLVLLIILCTRLSRSRLNMRLFKLCFRTDFDTFITLSLGYKTKNTKKKRFYAQCDMTIAL